jgi:hypothetical protein
MSQYPADILTTAQSIVAAISSRMEASSTLGAAATEVIAEAIAAERERCAKDAERYNIPGFDGKLETSWIVNATAVEIAAAIRSGEQP